jgi:tyrosine-protein phosphatase YwqE
MLRFFSRPSSSLPDLSAVGVDMHSHLIPGIDDGVHSLEESLLLIRQFVQMGYKKLVTTPHINARFKNTSDIIRRGAEQVRSALKKEAITIEFEAAAEYQVEDGFEHIIAKGDLLTFGNNCLLIELSYFIPHPALSEIIYELQSAGYNLILAHAERYSYWHHNMAMLESLVDRDVDLQVNLSSLSGVFGTEVRNMARRLIERGWISYAGSDVHNQKYMDNFTRGANDKYAQALLSSGALKNIQLL